MIRNLFAVAIALAPVTATAQALCPPQPAPGDVAPVEEARFTSSQFSESLTYLRTQIPALLQQAQFTQQVRQSELFYIGYPNHLSLIEGYALRQEALLRRAERDLVAERRENHAASNPELEAATKAFEGARQRYCNMVSSSHYVD